MHTVASGATRAFTHPLRVHVHPSLRDRNRVTTAFRPILAIPHAILVGAPLVAAWLWGGSQADDGRGTDTGAGGGVIGVVAAIAAVISWFAIVFTGRQPQGLRTLAIYYLRWRVHALAYMALLRDEYPPFGDSPYPVDLELDPAEPVRDRLSVAFRIFLAFPHLVIVALLGVGWAIATIVAWFAILLTGRFPEPLYELSAGVLRWSTRVEGYLLLLHDDYPPFTLE